MDKFTSVGFLPDRRLLRQGEHARGLEIFAFPIELTQRLLHLSNHSDKRLFIILIAAVESLLYRYTGEEELLAALPVTHQSGGNTVLLIQNRITSGTTWKDLILAVRGGVAEAEEAQKEPYQKVLQACGQNPEDVLQVGIALANLQSPSYLSRIPCPVIFAFQREGDHLQGSIEYNRQRYGETAVQGWAGHLLRLMEECGRDPGQPVADTDYLSRTEKEDLLKRFNPAVQALTTHDTLVDAFEAMVPQRRDQPAFTAGVRTLTYGELNASANRLARLLRQRGVKSESIAALLLEPSPEMIIGMLAVLKAGGAFLPLDPSYPAERIALMLQDAGVAAVLTDPVHATSLSAGYTGLRILLDTPEGIGSFPEENLPAACGADNLAYVIYTSGSTGRPKGVMIEHHSVLNAVFSQIREMRITAADRIAKYVTPVFDPSILEIFLALLSGAGLWLVPPEIRYDPSAIRSRYREQGITVAVFPNNVAQVMLGSAPDLPLRWMQGGGDVMKMVPPRQYPFTNAYGPTECAILATAQTIPPEAESVLPSIGRPIANMRVYILDEGQKPVPVYAAGELYIAGAGVGRGYLNRPELTAERFLPDPFRPGERMYRTGDRGRWLPDGEIEFLGRTDTQVKIRGFRIETGEVETRLQQHPAVREAAVAVKEADDGEKYLAAYISYAEQAGDGESPTTEDLISYLRRSLPEYMIPSAFHFLEQLPRTAQGKIDYATLPEPERRNVETERVAPQSDMEIRLAKIWSEILHIGDIGVTDHFFRLGGHSMNIAVLIAQIHREFQVELTYQDIFQVPVLRGMAELIAQSEAKTYRPIAALEKREDYPISYAQKRLWVLQQMEPASAAYNMPERIRWTDALDIGVIGDVFRTLIRRHESFRTYFTVRNGEPVQRILDTIDLPVGMDDLSRLSPDACSREAERIFQLEASRPFSLDTPPLFRIRVIRRTEKEYDLIFTQHHIISDGWSMEILIREFRQLYDAFQRGEVPKLPPLRVQYKDFAVWHLAMLQDSPRMQAAKTFWAELLREPVTGLNLPYDAAPVLSNDHRAAAYRFVLPAELRNRLKEQSTQCQASLFTLMLAAYHLFLARLTGQSEVCVGLPVAGREHEDLKHVVGFFINTTLSRLTVEPGESFLTLLQRVSRNMLRILDYQSFPLEMITEELRIPYPTISVFFNMLNLSEGVPAEDTPPDACHLPEAADVKFDMVCYLKEYANGIEIRCHYRSGLFKPATVEYLMGRYSQILREIAADPAKPLEEYGAAPQKRRLTLG